MLCVGKGTATKLGEDAGAVVRLGKRKLYNVRKIEEYIDKKKIVLASIINHENIDDIELCVSELKGYWLRETTPLDVSKPLLTTILNQ